VITWHSDAVVLDLPDQVWKLRSGKHFHQCDQIGRNLGDVFRRAQFFTAKYRLMVCANFFQKNRPKFTYVNKL
jgi:hypothetical protein